jgi:hypothetical protein
MCFDDGMVLVVCGVGCLWWLSVVSVVLVVCGDGDRAGAGLFVLY